MKTEMVSPDKLSAAKYNPRTMPAEEMERLKTSILEFGFVEPIVARREDGLIIGGHQRLAAYQALLATHPKLPKTVPVFYMEGLSDSRTRALNLALNKISGEWHWERLADLLQNLDDDGRRLSGFGPEEIDDVLKLIREDPIDAHDGDTDANIDRPKLTLTFKMRSKEELDEVVQGLQEFGMGKRVTKNGAQALASAVRAAAQAKTAPQVESTAPAQPSAPQRKRKAARA